MRPDYDAIVLGSGVGGCCAAALLAYSGKRVLLAEKRSYLGGRFSTVNRDGYLCATGGLAVPVGRNLEEVCDKVGVPSGVKPSSKVGIWLDGKLYNAAEGGFTRRIIREVAETPEEARRVLDALNRAMQWQPPGNDISFKQWLEQYTANPRIHGMFQATISSLLTVNSHELPAGEYFKVIKVISPLTFGFIEGGSLSLWERMAELIRQAGGEVCTGTAASKILVHRQKATGVHLRRNNDTHEVKAPLVISNLGPVATASLVDSDYMEMSYQRQLEQLTPTAIMWLHFSSDELLLPYSAVSVGCSRRVNMIDVPSFEAEGVAPPGKHLYTVGAAPQDSLQPGDLKTEFAAVMDDLRDIIPGFDQHCNVLTKTCYRGKWPGFRTVPGSRPSHRTPVENLYNVGDGVCPSGYEGSMGAAKSAQDVLADIENRASLLAV